MNNTLKQAEPEEELPMYVVGVNVLLKKSEAQEAPHEKDKLATFNI